MSIPTAKFGGGGRHICIFGGGGSDIYQHGLRYTLGDGMLSYLLLESKLTVLLELPPGGTSSKVLIIQSLPCHPHGQNLVAGWDNCTDIHDQSELWRYTGAHLYEQRRARTKIELTRGMNLHPCISQ